MIRHDVIIVGGGLAGLRAAAEMGDSLDVALMSRVHPLRSHSVAAQGGINASLANHPQGADDNPERHTFDTVKGADYLADQQAVRLMCDKAPGTIYELEHWGAPFSRFDDGRIAQRPFGGAGYYRTCYSADRTGHILLHTLYERAVCLGLKVYEEWMVTSLAVDDRRVCGLVAMNVLTGELQAFAARAVLFATGGYGQVYARSTNALINTGIGIAIGYRAGVGIKDLEFVQFHPTSLAGTHILISEAARGEGGYLLNSRGERFMQRYAAKAMELAPRDIVARSITTEITEGRGIDGNVHLDLRHLGAHAIREKLPGIRQITMDFAGVDPIDEPIPVVPAQHYSMGGLDVDVNGAGEVQGFYAAGECACVSVHGANRLGGNSLLDAIVFGEVAGRHAAEYARGTGPAPRGDAALGDAMIREADRLRSFARPRGVGPHVLRERLGHIMSEKAGVFRHAGRLREAVDEIHALRDDAQDMAVARAGGPYNQQLIDALDFVGMLDLAEIIVAGALRRDESRGSHYRTDHPKRNDAEWLHHTVAHVSPDGPVLSRKDVTITDYEPRERTY